MTAMLTLETFLPHLGQIFLARLDHHDVPLSLTVAAPLRAAPPLQAPRLPFELRFTGQEPLPQQTHVLEHAELGRQAIFLVPIGHGDEGYIFQAVFG